MSLHRIGIAAVVIACGAGSAQAENPVLLKYKYAKGDRLYYRSVQSMKQDQTLTIMNMDIKQKNVTDLDVVFSHVVDAVNADGNATLKVKAERRKVAAEFGGQAKYEFDSKSTDRDSSTQIGAELTPLLERLTGSEYELIVSPRGAVTEVRGLAELVGDLIKGKSLASQFASGDNKSAAYQEQDAFVILSDKPVKPGDAWEVPFDVEIPTIGTIKGKNTYTLEGRDKAGQRSTVRIGVVSDLAIELKIDNPDAKVSGSLTTSKSSQTVQFDPEAGRVVSAKSSYVMGGQLTVEAGGLVIPVANQQEHTSTWELLDKLE